ncbi:protein Shroom2-like isoform X2 [Paramacrobiotus metropolitanus]|nr:protein Shroom2-like isoform X2 [Paramacrobiotus metropolitanus]
MDSPSESFLSGMPLSARRSSLYASQPLAMYRTENISYTKSSSRALSRQSVDASNYPVCGLPSSTLYRKSATSKKTAFVEPLPYRGYEKPLPPVPGLQESSSCVNISYSARKFDESLSGMEKQQSGVYGSRSNSTLEAADIGTPVPPVSSSLSGLKPKNQRMMDLLHSHHVSNNNVFHATPSWSQTESPVITPIMPPRIDHKSIPRHSLPVDFSQRSGFVPEEVTELSATIRSLPLSISSQQCSEHFHDPSLRDYSSDGFGLSGSCTGDSVSSGLLSSRSSLSSGPSVCGLNLNGSRSSTAHASKLSGDRMKSRKNLTNASISSDELDDSASLKTNRSSATDRMSSSMPGCRSGNSVGDLSREKGSNAQLTTVKEVRTFQMRPNLNALKESGPSDSPSSVRSSPEEFQHIRNASMDSSVSWQSNSTTSSGYSSTTLSSSNLLGDNSNAGTDPDSAVQRRERSNTADAGASSLDRWSRSTAAHNETNEQSDVPVRSMSVSEMVRNFSGTKLLPKAPNPPPKPRYTHLPAAPADAEVLSGSSPPKPKSALSQHGQKSQSIRPTQVTFASMEDVRVLSDAPIQSAQGRRSSTAETPSGSYPFPGEEIKPSPVLKSIVRHSGINYPVPPPKKPALSVKPNTIFRTAVHSMVLGAKNTDDSRRKNSITEESPAMLESESNKETGEQQKYVPKYRKSNESAEQADVAEIRASVPVMEQHAEIDQQMVVLSEKEIGNENLPPWNKDSELNSAKREIIERLSAKLDLLREEQTSLQEEINTTDRWGDSIFQKFSIKATEPDLEKYIQHLRELEEITALSMSLSSRIERLELSLGQLTLPADDLEATTLKNKRSKLLTQQEEANYLQQGIERRRKVFQTILAEKYFDRDGYEDYEDFFKTKATLLRDSRQLADKIRLGEEKLFCLLNSSIPG